MDARRRRFLPLAVAAIAVVAMGLALWSGSVRTGGQERALADPVASVPRGDDECSDAVRRTDWEPRPQNEEANRTVPEGPVEWNVTDSFTGHVEKVARVSGNFTGTTDEILQWGACKWALDVDLVRAVAVKESRWHQEATGDYCDDGEPRSFGIMQIRHAYCDGRLTHGGHPWTLQSTALNVDYVLSFIRACIDGDFHDGGDWLYGGERVRGDVWGCVGAYYSGRWYEERGIDYARDVRRIMEQRPWAEDARFYGSAGPLPDSSGA